MLTKSLINLEPFLKDVQAFVYEMVKDLKAGRNDPCPCGSGLKFKKCCLNKTWSSKKAMTDLPPDDLKLMQELFRKHHDRLNKFGQVRPIAHANVKDQKVTSVGNQIYYSKNKSNSLTFIPAFNLEAHHIV